MHYPVLNEVKVSKEPEGTSGVDMILYCIRTHQGHEQSTESNMSDHFRYKMYLI